MLEHRTVLVSQAAQALVVDADGIYVDATFGRGGHTREILARLSPRGRLIALDRDPQAGLAAASITDARFRFERTPFSRLAATLASMNVVQVNGVLLDLGISSPQIDDAARGFSLRAAGPLDMRMDPSVGISAAEWLASVSVDELARVIRDYGEERFARPIAEAIVACRADGQPAGRARGRALVTTADLAAVVADAIPARGRSRKDATQHPATRTFQALRIHINQELEELTLVLPQAMSHLAPGGRLVVISFHSLEDRIVKRFIESHAHPERALDARLPLRAADLPAPRLRALGKIVADAAEVAANPRARSAVMRVAERTGAPWAEAAA
jgi:16S rRNA (cytosine1402-N4)-methyltransferase